MSLFQIEGGEMRKMNAEETLEKAIGEIARKLRLLKEAQTNFTHRFNKRTWGKATDQEKMLIIKGILNDGWFEMIFENLPEQPKKQKEKEKPKPHPRQEKIKREEPPTYVPSKTEEEKEELKLEEAKSR